MDETERTVFPDAFIAKEQVITLVVFNTLLTLPNIVINAFLIYAIWKLKLLNSISHRLIVCLNISDICIAVFLQPLFSAILLQRGAIRLRLAAQFFSFTFCQFSGVMTLIITLDRYIHMKYLQSYNLYMTPKRASFLIIANILSSVGLGTVYSLSTKYGFFFYLNITFIIIDFFVVVVSFILYTKTFLDIRRQIENLQLDSSVPAKTKKRQRPDLEFAKGMIVICILLAVNYFPYFIVGGIVSFRIQFDGKEAVDSLVLPLYWTYLLVYVNGFCNALVIIAFNKKIRGFTLSRVFRKDVSLADSTTLELSKKPTEFCSSRALKHA